MLKISVTMSFLSQTGNKESIESILLWQELDKRARLAESAEVSQILGLKLLMSLQKLLDDLTVFPIVHRTSTVYENTAGADTGSGTFQNAALKYRQFL